MPAPQHIHGFTTHARRGAISNAFRYSIDYVLIDPEAPSGPGLFSRNGWNFASVQDRDHGGQRDAGRGVAWARDVFRARGLALTATDKVLLLTQPRFLGYVFNPVSFWLVFRADDLIAAIAEVNNTFGDRHCYFCAKPDFAPIQPQDRTQSTKVFHVSPFQDVAGTYRFAFDITASRVSILIAYHNGKDGVFATLAGARTPLTNRSIIAAALRRPAGAMRTIALIHWQALKLKFKGARYQTRPQPPSKEVT